jgi:hypothetical protein
MYDVEEVDESEGRNFAREINAVFKYTSAKNASGIEELFRTIGNKFLDPNYEDETTIPDVINNNLDASERRQTMKISKNGGKSGDKKKECC